MRRLAATAAILALILSTALPALPDSLEFSEPSVLRRERPAIRWTKTTIEVSFSTSLASPGPNFRPGTDVIGAARRALSRWSALTNIKFVETTAAAQSVSPAKTGDGVSLITVADTPENNALFGASGLTGRTRVFYDPETGAISEADVCINPHPALPDGTPMQFSIDGTPGTYDLESTLTHEIGHLLGLDHSEVMSATMRDQQGVNGVYGLPAFTERTLSEEDRERVLNLYGPADSTGSIEGKLSGNLAGAHVWTENSATGRVAGSTLVVAADGSYRMNSLLPGQYRVFVERASGGTDIAERISQVKTGLDSARPLRAAELVDEIPVTARTISEAKGIALGSLSEHSLTPRLIGINGELSTIALPLEAGKKFIVYVGGEGVDQVTGAGISINSPFFTVEPASPTFEQFAAPFPVISFAVNVLANAPFGDYSIRLQSTLGEVAYLPGGVTIDPGVNSSSPNPVDEARFFVAQHYKDFLGREPDRGGLDYWVGQLEQCGADAACTRARRLAVSTAFFAESEFQESGSFIYALYKSALGRRPTFTEFSTDRNMAVATGDNVENKKAMLVADFVRRSEFREKYATATKAEEFVESLLAEVSRNSAVDLTSERESLLALYDGTDRGRAAVISRVASNPVFVRAEYNRAFLLMQYFGYLRREPDAAGYNFWLNVLQSRSFTDSEAPRGMVCAFLTSAEYQSRFGMLITHTDGECGH